MTICKTCGIDIPKESCNRFCNTTCMMQAPREVWEGTRFGRLTIVDFKETQGQKRIFLCKNYNGEVKEVSGRDLMDSKYKTSAGFKKKQQEHYLSNINHYKNKSDRNRRTINNINYGNITLPIKYRYYINDDRKKGFDPPDYSFEQLLMRIAANRCCYCDSIDNLGLDRIDNSKGHTKDNTVVCCYRCNMTRSNLYSHDEFKLIGKVIQEIDEIRHAQSE